MDRWILINQYFYPSIINHICVQFSIGTVFRYRSHEKIEKVTIPREVKAFSYFGYAVSSGYFTNSKSSLFFVSSAPHAETVLIFDNKWGTINVYLTLLGSQMGEYFGYTLLVDDFNNDGFSDLAVGAPLYSKNTKHEHGAVYIYLNQKTTTKYQV